LRKKKREVRGRGGEMRKRRYIKMNLKLGGKR